MEHYCSHSGCPNWATFRCDKCTVLKMPSSMGQYCSRDCQFAAYQSHTVVHALVETANKSILSFQGIAESIALAMKDASTRYLLPDIGDSQTVSVLLVGCRDFVEGSVDFSALYEMLIALDVFPGKAILYLEVTLCGPELTSRVPFYHPNGRVKVVRASGRLQRQFPESTTSTALPELSVSQFSSTVDKVNASHYVSFNTYNGAPAVAPAAALYDIFSCVFIRQPGFSTSATTLLQRSPQKEGIVGMLEQWVPAIRLLLNSGVLVLIAEYPEQDNDGHNTASTDTQSARFPPVSSPAASKKPTVQSKSQHTVSFANTPRTTSALTQPSVPPTYRSTTSTSDSNAPPITETSAEYYLDATFHAKIVIPATPYPYRRQRWSAPFPVLFPDPAAVPHPEVYEPLCFVKNTSKETADPDISSNEKESDACVGLIPNVVEVPEVTQTTAIASQPKGYYSVATHSSDGYYLAFQGTRDPRVTGQIQFYHSMAALNAHLRNTCLLLARELGAGLLHLPLHWPPEELELEAHRREMAINPLKKQLLEKEKQDILKRNESGKGSDIQGPALQFTRR